MLYWSCSFSTGAVAYRLILKNYKMTIIDSRMSRHYTVIVQRFNITFSTDVALVLALSIITNLPQHLGCCSLKI